MKNSKVFTKELVLNDLEKNHNHSWFAEVRERASKHPDKIALRYKGLNVTYKEYIETCEKVWAPALKKAGIGKGSTVVASIGSTPEYCYLMGAVSIVGAKINLISDGFDPDYIKEIINSSDSNYVFVGEDRFNNFVPIMNEINKVFVPVDLNNSLKNGDPYEKITNKFMKYDKEDYSKNVANLSNKILLKDFLEAGQSYDGVVEEESSLDDEFTITYSSGTTDGNKPKGIVHRNRHYIVMGRYHDSEVSGIPNLKDSITYSIIPTHSNSYVASIFSDTLMEGASIALDPITSLDYFMYGLLINKPYMAVASTSTWVYIAKQYYSMNKSERKNVDFSRVLLPAAVGEPLAPGEEKFLNKFLSDAKFGTHFTKLPYSISKMSACGGDCEHGSIFIRELRAYANITKDRNVQEPIGLKTYDFVDIKALREDGTYCDTYEYGRLVANSVCTMKGYNNAPERTKAFFIKDAYGKEWADLCCYGYFDRQNNVYLKGRMSEDKSMIPEFVVNDEIQKDTKNILSSSVISKDIDGNEVYIAFVEPQLNAKLSFDAIIKSIVLRCNKRFGDSFIDNFYINIVGHEESFPLTACLKRNNGYLREIGLTNSSVKASDIVLEEHSNEKKKDSQFKLSLKKHI